jgi:hypothetical protein
MDFAVGMAFFLVAFAFVIFFLTGYLGTSKPSSEIQQKGVSTANILLSSGIPSDWEYSGTVVRVGLTKDIYRIPILVETASNRTMWPMDVEVNFEGLTNLSQIRVTNLTGQTIPFQVQNISGLIKRAEVVFITNLTAGRNLFYIYFSTENNVSGTNFTGLNITSGTDFASDCSKRINTTTLTFVLCNGTNSSFRAGIRSLKDNSQGLEVATNGSIDSPYYFGDANVSDVAFTLTTLEEGPLFAKYKLNFTKPSFKAELTFKFFNGTPIWRVEGYWNGTNGNGTQLQVNTVKIFDKKQDSSEASEQVIPDTLTFNTATHGVVRNSSTNYSLATTISSNITTYKLGWLNDSSNQLVPFINSTNISITLDFFDVWHMYGKGNISNASDLYNQPNVTILPRESVQAISIDKLSTLANNISYSGARFSLDLGQDEFFIRISNDTKEIYSYGNDAKKRDVYVKSVKKVMQRHTGDIEFVTVTLGVWR